VSTSENATGGPGPVAETTSTDDVLSAPPVAPNGEGADTMDVDTSVLKNGVEESGKKRKSKHDGETAEERSERKRRKKEKKEKKEKRKSTASKADDSDESD